MQTQNQAVADALNTLGRFLAPRDMDALTREQLQKRWGIPQAEVMVLFGGSILVGGDLLAEAMKNRLAVRYGIVGGEGHTTQTLRETVGRQLDRDLSGLPEAEVFAAYLWQKYGLRPDFLECRSTNCGNNITYLLELLRERRIPFRSILLAQDGTMQRRMEAGLRRHLPDAGTGEPVTVVNWAVYQAEVVVRNGALAFAREIPGMWEMERYISLLMGEIPRLTDNSEGYGPRGRNFIAHVDIPREVKAAFELLQQVYGGEVRRANPLYASRE